MEISFCEGLGGYEGFSLNCIWDRHCISGTAEFVELELNSLSSSRHRNAWSILGAHRN